MRQGGGLTVVQTRAGSSHTTHARFAALFVTSLLGVLRHAWSWGSGTHNMAVALRLLCPFSPFLLCMHLRPQYYSPLVGAAPVPACRTSFSNPIFWLVRLCMVCVENLCSSSVCGGVGVGMCVEARNQSRVWLRRYKNRERRAASSNLPLLPLPSYHRMLNLPVRPNRPAPGHAKEKRPRLWSSPTRPWAKQAAGLDLSPQMPSKPTHYTLHTRISDRSPPLSPPL